MAQQDTGLGWSAESDWLMGVAGELARISSIGGAAFPNQPIPYTPNGTSAELLAGGFKVAHSNYYNADCYLGTKDPIDVLFGWIGNSRYVCAAGDVYFNIYVAWITPNGSVESSKVSSGQTAIDTATGLSYLNIPLSGEPVPDAQYEATFNTIRDMLDSVEVYNETFSKDSAGDAVACLAKWKTSNGTTLQSPILISSNTDYVDMQTTATGISLAKLNMLLSGVRFYMGFWDSGGDLNFTTSLQTVDFTDRGNMTLDQLFMTIISTSYAHVIIINSPDPYEEEGAGSGEEGGDGEDLEDDEMGISHHAIPAAINTGFCRIYCPTEQQLRDLSNFLWSAQFDISAVKKLFANPMDSVLGLSAVPLNLSGANAALYLGGVDTQMSLPMVSYQSYQLPMGAITVKERWGSYLDYDPYTKFSIFLPFIGFKDLSADDIMGKQIILDYDVDILSGACTARLQAGGNVLYQWSGQCSIQLPVTASNWNQVFQNATSAALSAGLAVATGSAGPVLAGALAAEGVQAIMGKPRIERGGTASGASGWMGGLTPYLVRVTPEAIIPSDQNKFIGYPAFSSISLGALTGYNEISSIHLEGIPATGAELEELESILKGGVIF